MIDIKETKKRYGYHPDQLSKCSNKRVIYICVGCGILKDIKKLSYKGENHKCFHCSHADRSIGYEKIVIDIKRVTKLLGKQPTTTDYVNHGAYKLDTVRKHFGGIGWKEILSTLGYKRQRYITDPYDFETVCKDVERVRKQLGHIPNHSEYKKYGKITVEVIYRVAKCNSYAAFIDKVYGIKDEATWKYFLGKQTYRPTESYFNQLRELAAKLGHTPTRREAKNHCKAGEILIERLKINWSEVLKQAGLDLDKLPLKGRTRRVSDEDIFRDIRLVGKRLRKMPTIQEYKANGKYGVKAIRLRFGSWRNLLELTGVKQDKNVIIAQEIAKSKLQQEIIEDIKYVAGKISQTPSWKQYCEHGKFGFRKIASVFDGKWLEALAAAGY